MKNDIDLLERPVHCGPVSNVSPFDLDTLVPGTIVGLPAQNPYGVSSLQQTVHERRADSAAGACYKAAHEACVRRAV